MSEQQQVAADFRGSAHHQEAKLFRERGDVRQARPESLSSGISCYSYVFVCFLLPFFSAIRHDVNEQRETATAFPVVGLSRGNTPFYWAFLPVD